MRAKRYFIVGGAGFIGSHFTDRLLSATEIAGLPSTVEVESVTLFDNFSSGRDWHFGHHNKDKRFRVVRGEVSDLSLLTQSMRGHDLVIHLASNPDIARAATEPDIDFREGTFLTQNVLEAMRVSETKQILYASGSGIYGDIGETEAHENFAPLIPVSTYGASKLAGEALISSYCYMFDMMACCFRFGNVVGPRQTHGVGFDFARRLLQDSSVLRILGDGSQSKSYIHVFDVLEAVLLAKDKAVSPFQAFNVATGDYITVSEIAHLAVECCGIQSGQTQFEYTGGNRGWKGDVPIVRLNTDRIKSLGWRCKRTSKEALRQSIEAMILDIKEGRMGQ